MVEDSKKQELVQVNAEIRELYAQPNADQKTLCHLYLKRAMIFYQLELWELCIFDVKRVNIANLTLLATEARHMILPYLKSCCNQAHLNELLTPFVQIIAMASGNKTAAEIVQWAFRLYKSDVWSSYDNGRKRSDYFWCTGPSASPSSITTFPGTEIRNTPGKGRGMFATQEFQPCEAIGRDLSFKLFASDNIEDICEYCGVIIFAPNRVIYCSGCHLEKYCSEKCQSLARNMYHSYFCGKRSVKEFLERAQMGQEASSNQGLAILKLIGMAKRMKVKSILELPVLRTLSGANRIKGSILHAIDSNLKIMAEIGDSLNPLWDLSDILLADNLILTNSFGDAHSMSVYPVISLVNHACQPSAKQLGHLLFSLKPIKPGEEITVAYKSEKGDAQREMLWSSWQFACCCEKCNYQKNLKFVEMMEEEEEADRQAYLKLLPKFDD